MKKISLCMIVKNEEKVIGRCLDSICDIVDEIIVVDTGSTDRTKSIVNQYTDKIYDFEWVNDFAKARNYSFSKATKEYILWLDADDVFLEEDRKKLLKLKEGMDGTVDVYTMLYNYSQDENGTPIIVQRRERIVKRKNNYQWISPIHEVIVPTGNIVDTDIMVTHEKHEIKDMNRNLKIFEQMIKDHVEFDDRQEYCYAKELYFLQKIPEAIKQYNQFINKYIKEYDKRKDLLYSALIELSDCYKRIGNEEKEWETLLFILRNQIPGKECLNRMADIFFREKKYSEAIFWFEKALEIEDIADSSYQNYYSNICIGVCYYWIGDIKKAYEYNEKAGKMRPKDTTYLYNKEILDNANKNSKAIK